MTINDQLEQVKLTLQILERYRRGDVPGTGARTLLTMLGLAQSQVDNIVPA